MTEEKNNDLKEALDRSIIERRTATAELARMKAESERIKNERLKRVETEKTAIEALKKEREKHERDTGAKNKDIRHVHVNIKNETVERAENLIRIVAKGTMLGCILIGPAGMGKTHTVEKCLDELDVKYEKLGGHISLAGTYEFLWENHNKLIFFDDVSQIINNAEIMELLKQAMNSGEKLRVLNYRSKGVLGPKVPSKFVFDGKIIMTFNTMEANNPNVKAITSRAPVVEMKFTHEEIIKAMYQMAENKQYWPELTEDEKVVIAHEIEEYTDSSMDVDLRKFGHACNFYNSFKTIFGPGNNKWQTQVHDLFGKKQESWMRQLVRELCGEGKIPRSVLVKEIAIRKDMCPRNANRKITAFLEIEDIFTNKEKQGDISIKNWWT